MTVKLSEVARHAGVSLATASRVVNGSSRTPAADIAERVKAAAVELGYVPNAQAQALARQSTALVGLVVHDIADPYFSTIAHGVQKAALAANRQVLLAGTDLPNDDDSPGDAELAAVNAFISYRTDAIILAASRPLNEDPRLSKALAQYIENGGRVVALGATSIPGAEVLHIANHDGASLLVDVLLGRGLSRFVILAGPPERNTARIRVKGFTDRLAEAHLEPLAVVPGAFTSQGGYDSTLQFLDSSEFLAGPGLPDGPGAPDAGAGPSPAGPPLAGAPPTLAGSILKEGGGPLCILAANDVMALGAMAALRSRGLSIPDDVQVAGFDDIPTLRDHSPGLTTYRLPLEEMGQLAATIALSPSMQQPTIVTGKVVLRESAGRK